MGEFRVSALTHANLSGKRSSPQPLGKLDSTPTPARADYTWLDVFSRLDQSHPFPKSLELKSRIRRGHGLEREGRIKDEDTVNRLPESGEIQCAETEQGSKDVTREGP